MHTFFCYFYEYAVQSRTFIGIEGYSLPQVIIVLLNEKSVCMINIIELYGNLGTEACCWLLAIISATSTNPELYDVIMYYPSQKGGSSL